ncbi:MAG: tRNA threonylcarbamoyladenosine dehydratase [Bacilli bacterium]|nr:tRNA threonylcarbamoyladenosine dehydratase [Bacilli bacterium]
MFDQWTRSELLLGKENMEKLHSSRVAVFGLGGVGGTAFEALVRAGVGEIDVIDSDSFKLTNINRQLLATHSTIGVKKTDAAERRAKEINPDVIIHKHDHFYLPDNPGDIDLSSFDYVIDCIDTVSAKLDIISKCNELGVPLICALGCGNRLDPSMLRVADINKTELDPLAKVIRKGCRERGIKHLKVVYSSEKPIKPLVIREDKPGEMHQRDVPGSSSFVPPAAGLLLAAEVVKDLTSFSEENRPEASIKLSELKGEE